ncbi:hypothetical protein PQE20_17665 [Vibrio harveyi]|uniref:hypothetical protein n=1 Tax=Vibrio TaxID=662 RepID=UPI000BE3F8BB|nr:MULTISPECIES: hypothetical protein [Vibrio harveyi group]ATI44242.1 hypothetical protein CO725_00890 [Vibrio parahaemolyticus]WCP83246.1 hypothetical protein PQE20_17665 [Vibrio harveyi]
MFELNRGEKVTYNKSNEKFEYEQAIRQMIDVIEEKASQNKMTLKDLAKSSDFKYLEYIKDCDYSDIHKYINLWEVVDYLKIDIDTKKIPAYK